VTLDPDVRNILEQVMKERGIPFKQALNDAIRTGLAAGRSGRKRRFVQKTYSLGAEQHFRWDKALAAADAIEDEELVRKLALRK
jgi:antitoxin component of RelBE/YafQ-DinJ toxin-antitoxin module